MRSTILQVEATRLSAMFTQEKLSFKLKRGRLYSGASRSEMNLVSIVQLKSIWSLKLIWTAGIEIPLLFSENQDYFITPIFVFHWDWKWRYTFIWRILIMHVFILFDVCSLFVLSLAWTGIKMEFDIRRVLFIEVFSLNYFWEVYCWTFSTFLIKY